MRFKLMLRGRGYIGAAGRGEVIDASDDSSNELSQPVYYFSEPQGILDRLFSRDKGIHRGFISKEKYDNFKALGVMMDSKAQLQNFGMGNYALFRVKRAAR